MKKNVYNIIGRPSNTLGGIEEFSRNIYKSFKNVNFIEIYNVANSNLYIQKTKIKQHYIYEFNFATVEDNSTIIINSISFIRKIPLSIFKKCNIIFVDHFCYNRRQTLILKLFIFFSAKKIKQINKALFFPSNTLLKNKIKKQRYYFPK
jgi:hypothetical protein